MSYVPQEVIDCHDKRTSAVFAASYVLRHTFSSEIKKARENVKKKYHEITGRCPTIEALSNLF